MSDIHVSNFNDFLTACQTSNANVIIDADVDANSWIPARKTFMCSSIDGQGHIIRNIHHNISGGYSLFKLGNDSGCTIKNVKFLNLVLTPGAPWGSSFLSASQGKNIIDSCEFQGIVQTSCLLQGSFHTIKKSVFTLEATSRGEFISADGAASYDNRHAVVDECYFTCNNSGNNYKTTTVIAFTYPEHALISNCYFRGTIEHSNNSACFTNGILKNCIINVDFSTPNASTINSLILAKPNLDIDGVTLYNTTKIGDGLTVAAKENLTGLTDSELKYPLGLTAIPQTGFPLLV